MTTTPTTSGQPVDLAASRNDFPILKTRLHQNSVPLVFLDNAASTQRPNVVLKVMQAIETAGYANVHRGIHWLSEYCTAQYEQARDQVQRFINAPRREEVIFTGGTTESINLVARTWGDAQLQPGDEILVNAMEHHANLVPWQQLAERRGAVIRAIPLTDDGRLQLDQLDQVLTDRTRLVAVTAVSNVLGTVNPVQEIVRRAHAVGALVLVDAAQSAAHMVTDVQALGADFLAFSGHKIYGPTGIGVLWGKTELLEAMPPFQGGGGMIRRVRIDGFEPAELPDKFEAGTPPIVQAIGLGAAVEYLGGLGFEQIEHHEQQLTAYAHEVLSQIEGLKILGPEPRFKAGIVSFTLAGVHPHDVAQLLDREGVAVRAGHHCTMPLHKHLGITASTRASFGLYNTLAEVDALAAALHRVKQTFARKS